MTVAEVYACLTMGLGFEPHYVLDEMTVYEREAAFKYAHYRHKEMWESGRLISYVIAKSNGSKAASVTDFMSFPWEEEQSESQPEELSQEEIEKYKKSAEAFRKILNQEKR